MTSTLWLVPLAAAAGVASAPPLDRAISTAVTRRTAAPRGEGARLVTGRAGVVGLALVIGSLEAVAAWRLGASWSLPPVAVFLAGLTALAWCDAGHFLLPKRIQHPTALASGALLVVAAAAGGRWRDLAVAIACGIAGFALFFALNLANPKAMGFGDVRLAGTVGLVAGWFGVARALDAFVVASVAGALTAFALLATRRIGPRSHLPYGVFLAVGAVVAILG